MSFIARGAKNAFRNGVRTFSIVIILALSTGLALTMLLARLAVQNRIDSVKSSIGNTITVTPAGERGFSGGGTPLTNDNVAQIKSTPHVTAATATVNDRLTTASSTSTAAANGADTAGGPDVSGTTTLVSPITPGKLGRRFGGGRAASDPNFTLPIMVTGTSNPTSTEVSGANQVKITAGATIDGNSTKNEALVGQDLAAKNNLKVGSTFSAYNQTITVAGIYDAGNTFSNAGIIMPLTTLQNLSGQPGDITNVIVQVDSISNLGSTVSTLQSKLGTAADVVSAQDSSSQALAPLENIKSITLFSLIGAIVAGSVIIFLTMLMIVRERRREIGVFKAIGSSNIKIVTQFISEALVLTVLGSIVGVIGGALLSNSVIKLLVSNNGNPAPKPGGGFGGGFVRVLSGGQNALQSIHTSIGFSVIIYGLIGAIIIALIGSAIPAFLIAKVRPAEVMRGE